MKKPHKNTLEHILSSRARAEIFRLMFGVRDDELHGREIERRSGLAIGTVRHELQNLESLDLLTPRKDGNRVLYRANRTHPLYKEIHNLVLKTSGLADVLKRALPEEEVLLAFVFGSVARDDERATSDVDLIVIGELGLRDLTRSLSGVADQIGREINPYCLSEAEFRSRVARGEHFITSVLKGPKRFIIGSGHELAGLGG